MIKGFNDDEILNFIELTKNLLSKYRQRDNVNEIIRKVIYSKKATRCRIDNFENLNDPNKYSKNRSMTTIGG